MRKPKRLTKEQIDLLDILIREIKFWQQSNDVDSPSIRSDINEALLPYNLNDNRRKRIIFGMMKILTEIKNAKFDENEQV